MVFSPAVRPARADTVAFLVDYGLWADVLSRHVNDQGRFDYEGLMTDLSKFNAFIGQVENADLSQLNETEQKAFWINAYNALAVKTILDHYPVKSIREINFGFVWDVPRKVAGGKKSLKAIEDKILRSFGDPRAHFAISQAAVGSPKLPDTPFYPQNLDGQLDREARRFMNDPEKILIDHKTNTLYHSSLFNRYEEDFLKAAPDVSGYIQRYINETDQAYIRTHKPALKELEFDWGLNR